MCRVFFEFLGFESSFCWLDDFLVLLLFSGGGVRWGVGFELKDV